MKILFILTSLIISSNSHPHSDRIIFHDEYMRLIANIDDELAQAPNDTAEFITHPDAKESFENGEYFQGDMRLTNEQEEFFTSNDSELESRTGRIDPTYHWPKNAYEKVIVPYVIDRTAGFSNFETTMIELAMEYIEDYTCILFVERTNQPDYIEIINGSGCYSWVGKRGGKQELSLQKGGCFKRGTIMHELIHALGYTHMMNHENRDNFVTILWENIKDGEKSNFNRVDATKYSNFETNYDYMSVMHYHPSAFSKNKGETISVKNLKYKDKIGQRIALSYGDVKRINNMYQCKVDNSSEN